MNEGSKRALSGSIHRIREFDLEQVCLVEEFDIVQIVGEGWFGKILLAEHRATDTEMVLKALPKPYVSIRDFYREFHYGLHLSAHKNIVSTYDVAFETAGFYIFAQEYAPLGDLTSNMYDTGIGELHSKRVAKQLSAALEHMHQRDLVHRDVKLDNVLVFRSDFSRIKLCDFGETRRVQSAVRRRNEWLPYSPPEILKTPIDSTYRAVFIHDIWQFGIVMFICLTGCLPWQKASFDDPRYVSYLNWYNSSNPLKKQPKMFKMLSSKAHKMLKKYIEPRPEKRATNFVEIARFIDDRWIGKAYSEKTVTNDVDELCPSMYSFHSDINEKNILLKHFLDHGIETTVDRKTKKERIREWIQNSIIVEETEDEYKEDSQSLSKSKEKFDQPEQRKPVADNYQRQTLRYDTQKHINPRTCEIINGIADSEVSEDKNNLPVENAATTIATKNTNGVCDENTSQNSNKDSAYGSLDLKLPNNNSLADGLLLYSVGKLHASLEQIPQNKSLNVTTTRSLTRSPISTHQSLESRGFSSSTSSQKLMEVPEYVSLKDTAYDSITISKNDKNNTDSSPFTSMNIVEGKIKINPYNSTDTRNDTNIMSITITSNETIV